MRGHSDTISSNETQSINPQEDFLGDPNAANRTIDPTRGIKTISVNYCQMNPERAKINNERTLIGRIGGTMMGVERQLRNPEVATKNPELAEYGQALVGNFNADVYDDDGVITAEYAEVGFCYLPTGFQEAALSRFARLPAEVQERGMSFSTFIFAEPATNLRGYRYMLQNAQRVEEGVRNMRIAMQQEAALIARSMGKQLALPDGRPTR